jgi:hypothetical protein
MGLPIRDRHDLAECNLLVGVPVTLEELARETLTQKNKRLRQEKCQHKDIYQTTIIGPFEINTNEVCLDCWMTWQLKEPRQK